VSQFSSVATIALRVEEEKGRLRRSGTTVMNENPTNQLTLYRVLNLALKPQHHAGRKKNI
jgi:hypothetical protein